MQDAVTQNKWRKERAKWLIFRKIAKWRRWRHVLHDRRQRQLSRTCTIAFRRYDTLSTSKSHLRWPGNPNGRSKFCNLRFFTLARSQLTLRPRLRGWRRLPEIAQTAHCRRQTHRRWPDKPNGRSNFHNLCLFSLARSQLMFRRWLLGWRQFPEIVQTAHCWPRKHRRRRPSDDQDRSKFRNYQNVCLWDQAKRLEKQLFAVMTPLLWWHCVLFFPIITRDGFCSHLRKIISRWPWPPPKNRDIHIEEFFVDSIYWKP